MSGLRLAKGERSPETAARLFRLARAREVLSGEAELEPWQVEERFGVSAHEAEKLVYGARQRRSGDMVKEGARFGKLTVLALHVVPEDGRSTGAWCLVRCDCGIEKHVRAKHLRRGHVRTCAGVGCRTVPKEPCVQCGRLISIQGMPVHIVARHLNVEGVRGTAHGEAEERT